MILVLASAASEDVAAFAKKFANAAASVFTCSDLAINKSSLCFPDFHNSSITIAGSRISIQEIKGVVNLLPAVFPGELFFYPESEREYQSSEFHAMLTFFLSAVRCPVLGKPSSISLNGPFLNPISWIHLAYQYGVPVSGQVILSNEPPNPQVLQEHNDLIESIYLNGNILTVSNIEADEYTKILAQKSNIPYLKAFFSQDLQGKLEFIRAQTIADIRDENVAGAIIDYFHERT